MKLICSMFLAVVFTLLNPATGFAHGENSNETDEAPRILGVLDFPNSGTQDAQASFVQGVLLLHSFEFDDSRTAFLEAQAIDPEFAMAIWGEALTLNHPLWAQQDRKTALEVLAKLTPNIEKNTTRREQMYLAAVRILYGEGEKPSRDIAYMQAMLGIYEAYPDDLDAASFYALSILGSVYERDFRTYMKAAAILEEVFAKEPKHPGAAHYLIHSYDDQVHAPLGLRAAREYSQIAPGAAHAQHMVSHIYTSLGRWDEVIKANRAAVRVSEESMVRAGKPAARRSKHALHWLEYALLQQGRFHEAKSTLNMMKQDLEAAPTPNQESHYVYMRGSWVCEIPLIDAQMPALETIGLQLGESSASHFTSGFGFMARGQVELARAELAQLAKGIDEAKVLTVEQGLHEDDSATSEDDYLLATIRSLASLLPPEAEGGCARRHAMSARPLWYRSLRSTYPTGVGGSPTAPMSRSLKSLLLFHEGETDKAVSLLKSAVEDENARPPYYGPPHVPKPSGELLGEMLLVLNRPTEAVVEFETALLQHTGRTHTLLGLARAAEAAGDDLLSARARHQVESNWKGDLGALLKSDYPWLKLTAE